MVGLFTMCPKLFGVGRSIGVGCTSRLVGLRFKLFTPLMSSTDVASTDNVKSLLYIPGDMANKVVSILKPAVTMDWYTACPEKIDAMRDNLRARGMLDVDVASLLGEWNRLKKIRADIDNFRLKVDQSSELETTTMRQTLRELSKTCTRLEEATMPKILMLPNDLHLRTVMATSNCEPTIVGSFGDVPRFDFEVTGHEALGRNTGTIVFRPQIGLNAYYFRGTMAWLELATLDYFRRRFEDAGNFTSFSNPDFCKSIVVEACNMEFDDPRRTFHLERDVKDANPLLSVDLHLTGSASTNAFFAFHTKTRANVSNFPLKYFAVGRLYSPVGAHESNRESGLFGVSQASAMSFFVATSRETPADRSHDDMLTFLQNAFEDLDLHFRVIIMPAAKLLPSESLRSELQLWSPARSTYHTVASVSVCEDFVSRRLLMKHTGPKSRESDNFLHICHGTAISVPQFLACVIENNQTKDGHFTIPTPLQTCVDRLKSTSQS